MKAKEYRSITEGGNQVARWQSRVIEVEALTDDQVETEEDLHDWKWDARPEGAK